jgi:hypothetical protein
MSFCQFNRQWIENSELRKINYDLKQFDASLLEGKILVRAGRQELAKPVFFIYINSMKWISKFSINFILI